MTKSALISETLKFHFGNKIFCLDGQGGILTQVLFDASTRCMSCLVIKQNRFFGKPIYVPFTNVTRANSDGIWLDHTLAELVAQSNNEGTGVAFDAHTVVKSQVGNGTLMLIAVQPNSGTLTYIVVHNLPAGQSRLLNAQYITTLEPGQITVSADETLLKSLPRYRSDSELQREVEQILFDLPFLHIDLKGTNLRVLDSVLYMDGNTSSTLRGELMLDQLSAVEGLLEIKNNLVGDDTLAANVALALGQDERTRGLPIGVYPQLGVVRLSGSIHNAQQKAAASEIARQFAGVRDVLTDSLLVDPAANRLYVMSAAEGGEAKDLTPGKFTRHTR